MPVVPPLNAQMPEGVWYKQRWPWLLMLGPAIVIVAGVVTTYLAFTSVDALVVDDYYKEGKAINQDLRRDRKATQLGLAMTLDYDAASGRLNGKLQANDVPVAAKIKISLMHPTLPEKDIKLETKTGSDGVFSVELPMLERARWQVLVESNSHEWRLMRMWKWPEQMSIGINADKPSPV